MVSGNDRLSGVTYASRDRKGNKEFFCSLPEGSEHAARAQQIASSIFSGRNGNSGTLIESSGSQRKLIGGTGQTGYVSPKRASSNGVRVRYVDTRGNESVGYAGEDLVNKADGRAEVTQMPEASRGFRHRGPTHTTFGLRSSSREMFVSAPNGSREAELHNRVATMGAEEVSCAQS